MRVWVLSGLIGLCAGAWSCEQGDGEGGPTPTPTPTPTGWGAACRPVAQSPFAQAMDDSGERFLVGNYLDLDHSSNVELLVTGDGGRTFRPVVAEYDRPGEGVELWRFDASFHGFWLGEGHVFVAVGGAIVSDLFNRDWMAISADGGLTWTHVLREPGVFTVPGFDGFSGNRRWRSGDAVLVSDGESYLGSLDSNRGPEPETLATLPSDALGVGARHERPRAAAGDPLRWDPGLLVMQVDESGDAYFVFGLREVARPGLLLSKWTRATGTFEQGELIETRMNAVRGELCVSPWNYREVCGEIGLHGCNPFGCDQGSALPVARPGIEPREADMLVSGEHVHVVVTVARTERPLAQPFNRFELQYLKLPRP